MIYNLIIPISIILERVAESVFFNLLEKVTKKKANAGLRSTVINHGKQFAFELLKPDQLNSYKPVWKVISNLRLATVSNQPNGVITAYAISDVIQHFNASELLIVTKGVINHPICRKGRNLSILVVFVTFIVYKHKIFKIIMKIITNGLQENISSVASDAAIVAILSAVISDPSKVAEVVKNLTSRDRMILDSQNFQKLVEAAHKLSSKLAEEK